MKTSKKDEIIKKYLKTVVNKVFTSIEDCDMEIFEVTGITSTSEAAGTITEKIFNHLLDEEYEDLYNRACDLMFLCKEHKSLRESGFNQNRLNKVKDQMTNAVSDEFDRIYDIVFDLKNRNGN